MGEFANVTAADLAGIYKEMAEIAGVENTYEIYYHFKGMQMVFPLKFYSNEYISRQLMDGYKNGMNIHDLVRKYGLSESRVRQIIRKLKEKD